jgi:hypothetical protein
LADLDGRHDDAVTEYSAALDAWRVLDCPLDLALCALDRAIGRAPGSVPAEADDEARAILTDLGAQPFLARLDQSLQVARVAG